MDLPDIRTTNVEGKRVLVRADPNVPMEDGEVAVNDVASWADIEWRHAAQKMRAAARRAAS